MKTLRLTLTKQWFDLILSGEKVWEYREYKPHWMSRILGKSGTRNFDEVYFVNGYGANRPYMRVEFLGASIMYGKYCEPDNGEHLEPEKKYFVISLGSVWEAGNLGEHDNQINGTFTDSSGCY